MKKNGINDKSLTALEDLMLDEGWLLALQPWMQKVNIFNVLSVSRVEIRHSNMLAWLLDPSGSHGLDAEFLERFVRRVCKISHNDDRLSFLVHDWKDAAVVREWHETDGQIDLLIEGRTTEGESLVIAIENKIDAKDGRGQLGRYRMMVKRNFRGKHRFVYLTPNGEAPKNLQENEKGTWICFPYQGIAEIIEEVLSLERPMDGNALALIKNYHELIKGEIMVDEKLRDVCNEIYRKHKDALSLIYDHADMIGYIANAKRQIKEWMKRKCKESNGSLIFAGERPGLQTNRAFQSEALNNILPQQPAGIKGSWANEDVYYYWFEVERNGQIVLYLVFGPQNVKGHLYDAMVRMARIIKPSSNLDDGVLRKVCATKVAKINEDFKFESVKDKLEKALRLLKSEESRWIALYKQEASGV